MSRRNFDRRFREITGTAPLTWLTLRPHFRRFTGSAPAAYRSTFGDQAAPEPALP